MSSVCSLTQTQQHCRWATHRRRVKDNIVAGVADHLIIEYAGGPQDHVRVYPRILLLLSDGATHAALAIV